MFNCIPVQAVWDITIKGAKCIETRAIYIGGSVPNVILDVIIVGMPIPYVWRLHAPLAQRLLLAGMFALGTFISVVSLVRLIIFLRIPISTLGDATYNFREIIVWSIVEINIGLTCACLPSLKPVLNPIGLNKLFSTGGSKPSDAQTPDASWRSHGKSGVSQQRKKGSTGGLFSTLTGTTRLGSEEDGFRIMDSESAREKDNVNIEMSARSKDSLDRNSRHGGISVQKDWNVYVDHRRI